MWIEGVGSPFTYKWPGGEVRLAPGQPIELPHDRALRLMAKVPGRVRAVETPLAIQPGDKISWIRGGRRQVGLVDYLHIDPAGIAWAFVTEGKSWCAVNLKFAQLHASSLVSRKGDDDHE